MNRSPPSLHTVSLVLLLLTIPGAALYGYAVARCWEWFAAPAVGVHLAWWQAAGLAPVARTILRPRAAPEPVNVESVLRDIGAAVMTPLVLLAGGAVFAWSGGVL